MAQAAWIDITRNINTGADERVVNLFTLTSIDHISVLYAIARVGKTTTYNVYEHLGADSPVVDNIWSFNCVLHPLASGDGTLINPAELYIPGGTVEEPGTGYIYIGNNNTGEIYVNYTPYVIDGDWEVISGPFGFQEFIGIDADLHALCMFNGELHAAHRGGVSSFNKLSEVWTIVGRFQLAGSYGTVTDIYVFKGELYATVSYDDLGTLYKYNSTVDSIDKWIKVADFPSESLNPSKIVEYRNRIFVFAHDPDKNIFDTDNIGTEFTGSPAFNAGDSLSGVPTAAIKYRKDNALWVTCAKEDYVRVGYVTGDVNGDGIVDWDDYADLLLAYATNDYSNLYDINAADINRDGAVGASDLIALANFLNGAYIIPGGILTDTTGTNLITNLDVNKEVYDITAYLQYSNFVFTVFTPPMRQIGSSTLTNISYPKEVGVAHGQKTDIGHKSVFVTNPITDLTQVFTIQCNLNVIDPDARWSQDDQSSTTVFTVNVGIANPAWRQGSTEPEFIEAPQIESVVNTTVPQFIRRFGHSNFVDMRSSIPLTYTFDARKLTSLSEVRVKFSIEISNYGHIDEHAFHPQYYRPIFQVQGLELNKSLAGVYPDIEYAVKTFPEIPEEKKLYHKVVKPSGPDQWFAQFSPIIESVGPRIYPPIIPEFFHGSVIRRLITNDFVLIPGGEYQLNFAIFILPYVRPNPFSVSVYTQQLLDKRFILNYHATGIPINQFNSYSTTFIVPFDAPVSEVAQTKLYLDITESLSQDSSNWSQTLTAPSVYISDINVVNVLYGPTVNTIYRYTGDKWDYITAEIVDPITDQDMPRSNLIDNFDVNSNEYQLYSTGGGRAWVYSYDGGPYSGSFLGIAYDERPQIVSIM